MKSAEQAKWERQKDEQSSKAGGVGQEEGRGMTLNGSGMRFLFEWEHTEKH